MPVITCQTPFYIFKLQFITRICSFHTFELSFHSDFIFRTQPSYHLTYIVKIKMKSQIIHTLRNRHYLRFFIKFKFPFFCYMFFHLDIGPYFPIIFIASQSAEIILPFVIRQKISDFKKLVRFKTLPICILPSTEGRNRIPLQCALTNFT